MTRILWIFSFLLIVSFLIFYIFQINEVTKASFLVVSREKKISELAQANENLKTYFSRENSSKNIESLVSDLNFEPIRKIHYIKMLETMVVTK